MKTLLLHKCDGHFVATGGADSAILRPGEPVFVPDPVEDWKAQVAPAIRIDRLGMNIKPAFAPRHYSEMSLVHLLLPVGESIVPPLFCDRSIAPGQWQPVPAGDMTVEVEILDCDDREMMRNTLVFNVEDLEIDEAVHFVSKYMTLKTGDMIIFGDKAAELRSPTLDTRLKASLNGLISLDLRYK